MAKQGTVKMTLMIVFALLIVVGVGAYASERQQNNLSKQAAQATTEDENRVITELLALYHDAGRIFLKADLTQAEIDAVNQKSENIIPQSETAVMLAEIQNKFNMQTDINNLFKPINGKQPLNGPILQRYNLIKPDLTQNNIDELKKKHQKKLPNPKSKDGKADGFYATEAHLIETAEKQVALRERISKQLDQLDSEEELTYEKLTMALDAVRKEIASLKNPHLKAYLIDMVGAADRELTQNIEKNKVSRTRDTGVYAESLPTHENDLTESSELLESPAEMTPADPRQTDLSDKQAEMAFTAETDEAYSSEEEYSHAYQRASAELSPVAETNNNEIMAPTESMLNTDEEAYESSLAEPSADAGVQAISGQLEETAPASDISSSSPFIEAAY